MCNFMTFEIEKLLVNLSPVNVTFLLSKLISLFLLYLYVCILPIRILCNMFVLILQRLSYSIATSECLQSSDGVLHIKFGEIFQQNTILGN